jgi:hypothetical protein
MNASNPVLKGEDVPAEFPEIRSILAVFDVVPFAVRCLLVAAPAIRCDDGFFMDPVIKGFFDGVRCSVFQNSGVGIFNLSAALTIRPVFYFDAHLDELLVPLRSPRLSWCNPAYEGLIGLHIFFEFGLGKTVLRSLHFAFEKPRSLLVNPALSGKLT